MHQNPNALMIFAAGHGKRMAPLTDNTPKPLLEAGGRALLDHALECGEGIDISRIVVNTHYLGDQIRDFLSGRNVGISEENPELLDTGGGLKAAQVALNTDTVFTLNSDVVWLGPNPLLVLQDAWQQADCKGLLLLVPIDRAHNRAAPGDFDLGASGTLKRNGPFVYTGAQIINTSGLADITAKAFSLNLYWDQLAAAGELKGVVYPGEWCDVGTPEGLRKANALWADHTDD